MQKELKSLFRQAFKIGIIEDGQLEMCFNQAEVTIVNKYVVELNS